MQDTQSRDLRCLGMRRLSRCIVVGVVVVREDKKNVGVQKQNVVSAFDAQQRRRGRGYRIDVE